MFLSVDEHGVHVDIHALHGDASGLGDLVADLVNDAAAEGLHIAVDHGVNLMALCRSIINEVSYKVSKATGVPVKRVDVYVDTMLID